MKTLTYGTLPSFREFADAVVNNEDGPRYTISLNVHGTDYKMLNELHLLDFDKHNMEYSKGTFRDAATLSAHALYALCQALTCLDSESDIDQGEWAAYFCSSILSTLGFEWV